MLRSKADQQEAELAVTRRDAQREINALAARLGELQAEANRLNALGERLTRIGQLQDGEFDFDKPVGVGGAGPVRDMTAAELRRRHGHAGARSSRRRASSCRCWNRCCSTASSTATPCRRASRSPTATSPPASAAAPTRSSAASQFHKGIDFEANVGDPVLAVADGVVSYLRRALGLRQRDRDRPRQRLRDPLRAQLAPDAAVGDLVRAGQEIAKAGSTGRSTGAHVHFEVWENGRVVNPRKFLGQQSPLKMEIKG